MPKPDIIFLLDVEAEIAFLRKKDTPSLTHIERRRKIYLNVAETFKMIILSINANILDVNRQMKHHISKLFNNI